MRTIKKVIACLLCVVLAFSCVASLAAAEGFKPLPTIYIKGAAAALVEQKGNVNSKIIYPVEIPDGYIGDACKELAIPLAAALADKKFDTPSWKAYNDGLYDAVMPIAGPMGLDKNGEAIGDSGNRWSSSKSEGKMVHSATQKPIELGVWSFEYDWRLDPIALSEELKDYIDFVKSKTGADKVNVIARCFGADVVLAYIDKYGAQNINDCILVCADFEGFDGIEAIASGNITLDSASVERFVNCYLSTDKYANDPTFETVRSLVTCLEYLPFLSFSADVLQKVVDGVKDDALRRMLREVFGTMPSCWSYIGDERFEEAKEYLFGGCEEEYAGVIEKIDAFHEILVRWESILDKAEADGMKIYNVCKYGFQLIPVTGKDDRMSDSIVTTDTSSFGATCSTLTGQLSASYLQSADPKYVSPDKQIDASTCRYPDHTWFVKNLSHRNMPACLDYLFAAIIEHDGYTTVFDLEEFPQYIVASDDSQTISGMTVENGKTEEKITPNPLKAFFDLIMKFFDFIISKFKSFKIG